MSSILMIAYHFPPLRGSSGIQRTLRFCRYLPEFGWSPVVLTAHPRAYESVSDDLIGDVPDGVPVVRAFALNAARHFAFAGRHPGLLAIPDRWSSWVLGGVISGLRAIKRHRIDVIFSTYPIASAHLIGLVLSRLTGLPWIADFRDPMAQDGYPADPTTWRAFRWIEERTLRRARRAMFTSPGAIRDYRARYPDIPADRYVLIENGYDEEAFAEVSVDADKWAPPDSRRLVCLHSGIVYSSERDPTQFFRALGALKRAGRIDATTVEFRFRASANDEQLARLASENGIEDLVSLAPPIPYREALMEMLAADALLVMQASNCNSQIPAKAYEYLRAGRPVLALTDPAGDTADLMHRARVAQIIPLDSAEAITRLLPDFLDALRTGTAKAPSPDYARHCSRRERTREFAEVLRTSKAPTIGSGDDPQASVDSQ